MQAVSNPHITRFTLYTNLMKLSKQVQHFKDKPAKNFL